MPRWPTFKGITDSRKTLALGLNLGILVFIILTLILSTPILSTRPPGGRGRVLSARFSSSTDSSAGSSSGSTIGPNRTSTELPRTQPTENLARPQGVQSNNPRHYRSGRGIHMNPDKGKILYFLEWAKIRFLYQNRPKIPKFEIRVFELLSPTSENCHQIKIFHFSRRFGQGRTTGRGCWTIGPRTQKSRWESNEKNWKSTF